MPRLAGAQPPASAAPKLYVQLISTCVSDAAILEFMLGAFTADELATWAVLDLHHYYAWSWTVSGCVPDGDGDTTGCGYECGEADAEWWCGC